MHIIFYRYGSICEPDIMEAFQELGHTVWEIDIEIYNKNPTAKQCLAAIDELLQMHAVDCIFSMNFYPLLSEACQIYHVPYISWVIADPVLELYTSSIKNGYNRTFIFDRTLYLELAEQNPGHIFYLPLATNVRSKQQAIASMETRERQDYAAAVSFVGSLYTEKCPYDSIAGLSDYTRGYLESVMAAQQKVYGYYFIQELLTDDIIREVKQCCPDFYHIPETSFLTEKELVSQFYIGNKITSIERRDTMDLLSYRFPTVIYTRSDTSMLKDLKNRGPADTLNEMPVVFHESCINLNMTSRPIRSGIPLRLWDILGSGGFALSNFQSEIPEYFQIGQHLDVYGSMEELLDKCSYYLNHQKERMEIAVNGLEEIKRVHTYTIRVEQMLAMAFSPMQNSRR